MSDITIAASIDLEGCAKECDCQGVHIFLTDYDGELFALASLDPAEARAIAAGLTRLADAAELQKAKNDGRVM